MIFSRPIRWFVIPAIFACGSLCAAAQANRPSQKHAPPPAPAPIVRRAPENAPPPRIAPPPSQQGTSSIIGIQRRENPGGKAQGEHLAGWLDRHSNLTSQQQQQALEKEPGFHDLPGATQQRYRDRLAQLDSMPPDQRTRIIQRTEEMARLTPEQRGQVRGVMQQLGGLSPDRKRTVSRTFRVLRTMPPAQRQAYINSPEFRAQFSDQERATLNNLMSAEPLIPQAN